jgi:hypothetical protein
VIAPHWSIPEGYVARCEICFELVETIAGLFGDENGDPHDVCLRCES